MGSFLGNTLGNLAGCIGGLVFLGIILLLANGAIALFNRLAKGPKRLEFLAVVIPVDGIAKYAPQATAQQSGRSAQVDLVKAASLLFGNAKSVIGERELKRCASKRRLRLITYQPGTVADADAAVGATINALLRSGVSRDALRREKAYSIKSPSTPDSEMGYLVVLGNLPTPPSFMLVPSFE